MKQQTAFLSKVRGIAIRLLVATFAFILGVASPIVWVLNRFHPDTRTTLPRVENRRPETEDKWLRVDMGGRFFFYVPPEMKESRPEGEYSRGSFVKEFSNGNLEITAGYNESDTCPSTEHAEESLMEIDGQKATLAVDHFYEPTLFISSICFPRTTNRKIKVWISTTSKSHTDLATANRIFASIRFQ